MAEDLGEKTEDPTGKKLADARNRGKIAKSKDLTGAIDLITAAIVVGLFGSFISGEFADLMARTLGSAPVGQGNPLDYIAPSLHQAARVLLVTVGPIISRTTSPPTASSTTPASTTGSTASPPHSMPRRQPASPSGITSSTGSSDAAISSSHCAMRPWAAPTPR